MKKKVTVSDKAQIASYKVVELIAQKTKPHSVAESFILTLCSDIVKIMFGDEASNEISKIPLSNDTIRRINDMSVYIEENVNKNIINTNFALQIDESTVINGKAQLIGFFRFIHDNKISNQFLFCKELIRHTKGQDVFEIVNSYFKQSNISWEMCVGICTNGAPSMVGSIKGFITLAKQIIINIIHTQCFLHREALIAKTLPQELKALLDQTITMVNYIKSRPLKSRIFKQLCNAVDAKHECLLLHTEVRWLSRGKVLMRVFELKEELLEFYSTEGNIPFGELLKNE